MSKKEPSHEETEHNTLKLGEPHPMAESALQWIKANVKCKDLFLHLESLSSCAIEGNRLAEICAETLHRLLHGEPISDRYLLGLAWYLITSKELNSKKGGLNERRTR